MSLDPNPFINQADFGTLGEKKFIIDAVWWRQWCDYVNFTPESDTPAYVHQSFSYQDDLIQDTEEEDPDNLNCPFSKTDSKFNTNGARHRFKLSMQQQSSIATMELALEAESQADGEQSQLFYERPTCIDNNHLLDPKGAHRNWLKRTLVEHFDYEVVCQKVWIHLYSWYSADVTIARKLVKDHQSK